MSDPFRFAFRVRKGGTHYYNADGEETDAEGNPLTPAEPDYHAPGDEQQIIEEHRKRGLEESQTISLMEEAENADSETVYPSED